MSQKITFMVIPEGSNRIISKTLNSRLIKFLLAVLFLWLTSLVALTIMYSRLSVNAARAVMLEKDNDNLRRYIAKVVDIEESFKKNRELTARLAEMAGIDLNEIDAQPELNLESLIENYPDSVVPDTQAHTEKPALSPGELAKIRIPQGRPLYGWVSRSFKVDVENEADKHTGIDFAVKRGTSVVATASGVVVFAGWDKTLGNLVIINHDDNYQTLYGHNDKLLVEKGQEVLKGDIIAFSGNTGRSSAPHLHYEIRKNGEPIDPTPYLD